MSVLPHCTFELQLDEPVLVSGTRTRARLVLGANQPIPRAERLMVAAQSLATAMVGSGRNRTSLRRTLWNSSFEFPMPSGGLPAGKHVYVFDLDVPASLGAAFRGEDCAREHALWVRLDVDWAVDPTASFPLSIVAAPVSTAVRPLLHRSAPSFAEDFLVDLSLESDVLVWGQPLRGEVAVRTTQEKKCKHLRLQLASRDTVFLDGASDVRRKTRSELRIAMSELSEGRRVRFTLPFDSRLSVTHQDGSLDSEVELIYALDLGWSLHDASIPIQVLPQGSKLEGAAQIQPLHERHLRRGNTGVVRTQVTEAPRDGKLGAEVLLELPDLDLGIRFRELGLLDGFTTSPLLPPAMAHRYRLRTDSPLEASLQTELFDALLGALDAEDATSLQQNEVVLDDRTLRYHLTLQQDEQFALVERGAHERSKRALQVISSWPFSPRLAEQETVWRTVAAQAGALLLPHRPAIVGLSFSLRTQLGAPREFPYEIRTHREELELLVHVAELDGTFRARGELGTSPMLASLREEATLDWGSAWTLRVRAPWRRFDPRRAVAAVETLAAWVMHARGEAVIGSPYR